MLEHLIIIGEIFIACLFAEGLFRLWDALRDKRLDIGCDYCEEAKKTYRSPDKRYWLCKACMEVYIEDRGLSGTKVEAVRKKYGRKEDGSTN